MPRALSRRGRRAPTVSGRGMVLSPGRPESALWWARRGLGPLLLAPLDGWTLVVPAGAVRARYPYDDAVRTLAGRPAGWRMRPAIGFFQVGRQAVITLHPKQRLATVRWLIWTPRDGSVPPKGLPAARIADVVEAAGAAPDAEAAMRDVLADGARTAEEVLRQALEILDLPGADVLFGARDPEALEGARTITPRERHARAFDRILSEEDRYRQDQESP